MQSARNGHNHWSPTQKGDVETLAYIATAATLNDVMERATHAVRALLAADGATFVLRDGVSCHYAEEDAISPLWKGRRFPMRACISGWCMKRRQPAAIPDIYRDARIPKDAYRPTFVRSLAMVPVGAGEPTAAIGAYWSEPREITSHELETLERIADSVSGALAFARERDGLGACASRGGEADAPADGSTSLPITGLLLRPNSAAAYGFAALCLAAATAIRFGVGQLGSPVSAPFSTYYPAALIALLAGGARAGVFTAVLGGVLAYVAFLPPYAHFAELDAGRVLDLLVYALSMTIIIVAVERYREATRRLADADSMHLLLARELQHRSRNALSMIESIVRHSLVGDPGKARLISDRIRAGLVGGDLLAGPDGAGSLRALLTEELAGFGLSRFLIASDDVTIGSRALRVAGLVVHELGTNAVKYGALSNDEGRVAIDWALVRDRLTIRWDEIGGPPVEAPRTKGYGTLFLRRLLKAYHGAISLDYEAKGLKASISLPSKG